MSWEIKGQYMETCNCDFLCPCPLTGLAETTHGNCIFAMAYSVDKGQFDDVSLDGSKFVVVGSTPGNMGEGNWEVGLIVDDATSGEQREALGAIVGGQAGGPMAALGPLMGKFLGMEARPITFEGSDGKWSVRVPDLIDQEIEGARGLGGELMHLDNAGHPASNTLGLARATHSTIHAFGINFEQSDGRNNGHFAPFSWSGA
ncbi:MAG: DUF1326 domain-containing protein [Dehalococcoidia bacterium]